MIIKEKYNAEKPIAQLEEILKLPSLSPSVQNQVKQELRKIRSGLKGEKEAAYYIDYYLREKKNWVLLHDLRLEHNNRVAQIDHLLINRLLDFYVLETKHFSQGLRITEEGEFLVYYKSKEKAIPSPIEQNRRHVILLEEVLKDKQVLPKRLGITLHPKFKSYVLISPHSLVDRPNKAVFDTSDVMKADALFTRIDSDADEESPLSALGSLTKLIGVETLQEIGYKLTEYHQPLEIDYYTRFGIKREVASNIEQHDTKLKEDVTPQNIKSTYYCYKCRKPISRKVALFCFGDKQRFGKRAYCYDCQKQF